MLLFNPGLLVVLVWWLWLSKCKPFMLNGLNAFLSRHLDGPPFSLFGLMINQLATSGLWYTGSIFPQSKWASHSIN